MDESLRDALIRCETDVDEALYRLSDDVDLYMRCLKLFLQDTTMAQLADALRGEDWDAAFTAAHAMKGLAGNMGFIPLFHTSAELVIQIRTGKIVGIGESYRELKRLYDTIYQVIEEYFSKQISECEEG